MACRNSNVLGLSTLVPFSQDAASADSTGQNALLVQHSHSEIADNIKSLHSQVAHNVLYSHIML